MKKMKIDVNKDDNQAAEKYISGTTMLRNTHFVDVDYHKDLKIEFSPNG